MILLCSYNNIIWHGWVQACANGRVGGMGGYRDCLFMGGLEIYHVMYNNGVGLGGEYVLMKYHEVFLKTE